MSLGAQNKVDIVQGQQDGSLFIFVFKSSIYRWSTHPD